MFHGSQDGKSLYVNQIYVPHTIFWKLWWSEVFLWTMELLHYISVFVVIYATRITVGVRSFLPQRCVFGADIGSLKPI